MINGLSLEQLAAGMVLKPTAYGEIDRHALTQVQQIMPPRILTNMLALGREPIRMNNPRNLAYTGSVRASGVTCAVSVSVLADPDSEPVVMVRSAALPESAYWDDTASLIVTALAPAQPRLAKALLRLSGHAARVALWQGWNSVERGKYDSALEADVAHLAKVATEILEAA